VENINRQKMPFMQRENISVYLNALKGLGMNLVDLFDTQDLYDNKNIVNVINHFYSLSGFARGLGFEGPFIGVSSASQSSSSRQAARSVDRAPSVKKQSSVMSNVSQQNLGSYGVDRGAAEVRLGRDAVRDPNLRAQQAEVKEADEDTGALGSLDRDVQRKLLEKYDPEREAEVVQWMSQILGKELNASLAEALHDGQDLCEFFNLIFPDHAIVSINRKTMAFFQRENISHYLDGCKDVGMSLVDLFDTQDLYDAKNMVTVCNHFYQFSSFARNNSNFGGPWIGVKMAERNVREFTEEQMRRGQFVMSAQTSGSHGVLEPEIDIGLNRQIIKDVDAREESRQQSKKKAQNLHR